MVGRQGGAQARVLVGYGVAGQIAVVPPDAKRRTLTLFADFVCPFSYLTVRGLAVLGDELRIDVAYRAFELAPPPSQLPQPPDEAQWSMVAAVASEAGITIERPRFVARTRKAHEAAKYAEQQGAGAAMRRAIYEGYFVNGLDIGRIDVLTSMAADAGLDRFAMKVALDVDVHIDDVLADRATAEAMEITGTPALLAGDDVHIGYLSAKQMRSWLGD